MHDAKSFPVILFVGAARAGAANLYIDNITPTANNRRGVTDNWSALALLKAVARAGAGRGVIISRIRPGAGAFGQF